MHDKFKVVTLLLILCLKRPYFNIFDELVHHYAHEVLTFLEQFQAIVLET